MKKLTALIGFSVLLFSVTGCGDNTAEVSQSIENPASSTANDVLNTEETETLPGVYDINHNGHSEVFTLTWDSTSLTGSGVWKLSLFEDDSEIWCDYAGLSHASSNTIFKMKIDGDDYLLRYVPYMGQGIADYWYEIFSLDPESIAQFLQEVHFWLNDDSELLLSTEGGTFCSGGSGASFKGDEFWGEAFYDPEKSLEENLQTYAEELTKMRAAE